MWQLLVHGEELAGYEAYNYDPIKVYTGQISTNGHPLVPSYLDKEFDCIGCCRQEMIIKFRALRWLHNAGFTVMQSCNTELKICTMSGHTNKTSQGRGVAMG